MDLLRNSWARMALVRMVQQGCLESSHCSRPQAADSLLGIHSPSTQSKPRLGAGDPPGFIYRGDRIPGEHLPEGRERERK